MTAATTVTTVVTTKTIATPWNRALCENLIVAQLVRKFQEIYGNLPCPCPSLDELSPYPPNVFLRYVLICCYLCCLCCLSCGLLPLGFSAKTFTWKYTSLLWTSETVAYIYLDTCLKYILLEVNCVKSSIKFMLWIKFLISFQTFVTCWFLFW